MLHPQAWSGKKLVPVTAYGLRVYGNGSTLVMHHDKVCSFLLLMHTARQYPVGWVTAHATPHHTASAHSVVPYCALTQLALLGGGPRNIVDRARRSFR